jgi:hypothetical protein
LFATVPLADAGKAADEAMTRKPGDRLRKLLLMGANRRGARRALVMRSGMPRFDHQGWSHDWLQWLVPPPPSVCQPIPSS